MDTISWTADQILTLPQHQAASLFGSNPTLAFRKLARYWHPDVSTNPQASEVFARILALRETTKRGFGQISITGTAGVETIHLEPQAVTDTGRRWVGPGLQAWSFETEPDLAEIFIQNLRSLPFADQKMRKQMRKVFPKHMRIVTHENAPMIMFPRHNTAILADWIATHGSLPPVHAAWLGSGLLNIAAYANWSDWSLPTISLDTIAIDPATHLVTLPAGWEAVARAGNRPVVATKRTLGLCPALAAAIYLPPATLTRDVVRQTLREAFGDPSGLLLADKGVPTALINWIQAPSPFEAIVDYDHWYQALRDTFGIRKFVKWDRTVAAVYPNFNN